MITNTACHCFTNKILFQANGGKLKFRGGIWCKPNGFISDYHKSISLFSGFVDSELLRISLPNRPVYQTFFSHQKND